MMNRKYIYIKRTVLLTIVMAMAFSCERELSDEAVFASFPNTAEVFIDGFSGGLEYLPFAGSKLNAFSVDEEVHYSGSASMRFDIPNVGDPSGSFAGAVFPDNGGRNLTGYDALTFWAKATKAATINEIGFGNNFGENKFLVTKQNLRISTSWTKYIIPIPDPSKLVVERGMFWYSEGPEDGDGYTFWIDELKFENLGTLAQPNPQIFNGEEVVQDAFIDVPLTLTGLTQTFNLESGANQTVIPAPSYFTFTSTNPDVARVNEQGIISVVGNGQASITATLANVAAAGSLALTVNGTFDFAPTPPQRNPENVVSVFSDSYNSAPIEYYNGFFNDDGQETQGGVVNVSGEEVIRYSELNFVALKTINRVNASAMTNIHVDIKVEDSQIDSGDFIRVLLLAQNPDGSENEASVVIPSSDLVAGEWISFDGPLSDFSGVNTSSLSLFFFVSDSTVSSILVDNLYFYRE